MFRRDGDRESTAVASVLALQRQAGNVRVTALLQSADDGVVHEKVLTLQRQATPAATATQATSPLPGFSQKTYVTCGAASLVTALVIWDRERKDPAAPNNLAVTACNLILSHMLTSRNKLVKQWNDRKENGPSLYRDTEGEIKRIRAAAAGPGGKVTESDYQMLGIALTLLFSAGARGLSSGEIGQLQNVLGLGTGQADMAESLDALFDTPLVRGLQPGQIAQASWFSRTGSPNPDGTVRVSPHVFLIGRLKDGTWFVSDQGTQPATELKAPEPPGLPMLKSTTLAAAKSGRSALHAGPKPFILPQPWTGVTLLAGGEGVEKKARGLISPGSFLAEVDAGSWPWQTGDRIVAWDFLSRHDSLGAANAAFLTSGSGHGGAVVEMPEGVFSLYKTSPVDDDNVTETAIDQADSAGGLFAGPRRFLHAWLMLGTSKGRKMPPFPVY